MRAHVLDCQLTLLVVRGKRTISRVVMNSTSSIDAKGTSAPTAPDIVVYTNTSLPPATSDILVILLDQLIFSEKKGMIAYEVTTLPTL